MNLQADGSSEVPEPGENIHAVGDIATPLPKPLSAVTKPLIQLLLQVPHPALMNTSTQHHTRTMVLLLEQKTQTHFRLKFSFDLLPGCLSVMTRLQVGSRFGYRGRQKYVSCPNFQTAYLTHPASSPVGARRPFKEQVLPQHNVEHLTGHKGPDVE